MAVDHSRADPSVAPKQALIVPDALTTINSVPTRRPPVGSKPMLLALQRSAGNAAVARLAATRSGSGVQRWTNPIATLKDDPKLIQDGLAGDVEAIKHIEHYDSAIDAAKIGLIKVLLDNGGVWGRNATALVKLWDAFGPRLPKAAGENIALWKRSVEAETSLRNLAPVKDLPGKFIGDVVATAQKYLTENEKTVNQEVTSLGGDKDDKPKGDADVATRVKMADLQEGAKKLTQAREAMKGLEMLPVGVEITGEGGVDERSPLSFQQVHLEGGPPGPESNGGKKTYNVPLFQETMTKYALAQAVVNGLMKKYPALMGLEGGGADPGASATLATAEPDAARANVLAGLHRVREHIADTRGRLGGDLPYELQPIHQQLLGGKVKTSNDWTNPFAKSIGEATVKAYEDSQFWVELGLTTLAAAAFVVAEIATGGMATFFVGFAVGVGMGQAAQKWQKAKELSDAAQASLDPDAQLVSSGQAEAAGFDALLSTVFAFIDLKMAASTFSKIGKLAELAKVGEMTAANAKPLIEKAIADYGVEAVAKSSNKTAAELLELVGKDSPAASRLRTLAEAPRVPKALESATELGAAAKKAASTRGMGALWTLMTRGQRAAKLLEIVNERLVASGKPALKGFTFLKGTGAHFDMVTWKLAISEAMLTAWIHTEEEFAKLIETAYHEARHCEQWFDAARYRAATLMPGENAGTLAKSMHIPQDVADAAVKNPAKFGTPEFNEGHKWYEAVYGAGRANREKVLADLKTWGEKLAADRADLAKLRKAGASAADISTAEGKLAATEASEKAAYQAYRALPEEVDAWKVGEDAATAFRKEAAK